MADRGKGRLVYSTCSLENDENEAVAAAFTAEQTEFAHLRLAESPISSGWVNLGTETGAIRTWPHLHDVDGFFMIAFQRCA